jgi:hypothetical protein
VQSLTWFEADTALDKALLVLTVAHLRPAAGPVLERVVEALAPLRPVANDGRA